jgi:ketosteroid isomerase-like protein
MTGSTTDTAKAIYDAYVAKDRDAAERLIAQDFRFTSPLDNGLDRESYFAICWPNSEHTEGFEIVHMVEHGEQVFVTYEGQSKQARFRNTEILTVRDGQIAAVEVYFGWNVPHDVPSGVHRDPSWGVER